MIGKLKNINIKQNGMKNAGATNTTVLLGWKFGFIVAFIDIIKAVISLMVATVFLNKVGVAIEWHVLLLYVNALFVIVGHNYPIQMSFNGGKGKESLFVFILFIYWIFSVCSVF